MAHSLMCCSCPERLVGYLVKCQIEFFQRFTAFQIFHRPDPIDGQIQIQQFLHDPPTPAREGMRTSP